MKAYILNFLNRYKRYSENQDVKTAICNRSWWVFNDCGEKELYIFQEDNTLIISLSGRVTKGTWEYVPTNRSLIITAQNESYMLHLAFMDNVLFALQVDGTQKYSFMIDENNRASFKPKTLRELQCYFEEKEQESVRRRQIQMQQMQLKRERLDHILASVKKHAEERERKLKEKAEERERKLKEKKEKLEALKEEAEKQWEVERKTNKAIRKKIIAIQIKRIILTIIGGISFLGFFGIFAIIRFFDIQIYWSEPIGVIFGAIIFFGPPAIGYYIMTIAEENSEGDIDVLKFVFISNYVSEQAKKRNIDIE